MATSWTPTVGEIVFAIILVIIPWSFPSMGIGWRCVLWFVAWALFIHLLFELTPALKGLSTFVKISLSMGVTGLLAAVVYTPILWAWRAEQAAKTDGELVASESFAGFPTRNPAEFVVKIGTSETEIVTPSTLNHPINILGDKFTMNLNAQGNVIISTVVRDRNGNLIAEIIENKWRVSNQSNLSWDKNYKKDMLEVLDGRGRVVLQVKLFTNGIQLQGEWYREDGRRVRFQAFSDQGGVTILGPFGRDDPPIQNRFKYPSSEHWGEFAN